MSRIVIRAGVAALAVALVAGCSVPRKPAPAAQAGTSATPAAGAAATAAVACKPVGASQLVGTWYSVSKQPGIKGEMRRLLILQADGSYRSESRQQDARNIRAELRENGCWETSGNTYTTRVTHSNGEAVDGGDIYRNTYRIERLGDSQLVSRENVRGAPAVTARKMQPGYRMP